MPNSQESVAINLGDPGSKGPTIEESLAALKAEGLVQDDETNTALVGGEDAQGGADGDAGEGSNDRPSWLPEKFKTPEDFAKAYAELERKQSQGKTDDEATGETEDSTGPTDKERAQAEEATQKAGLDLNTLSQKYADNGKLDDSDFDALAKAGYPREMVEIYIDGLKNREGKLYEAAYGPAGGKDEYQSLINWASQTLSEDEIAAYDAEVNSGNPGRISRAVKALKADYDKATAADRSEEPEVVITGGKASVDVYASQDEYMLDLENPLYEKSSAFRNKVMQKLARSNI